MEKTKLGKKRNISIDYMKFIAVLLVMNSHMDICYAKFSQLSTGGIVGDALFFFASGFGLFLGRLGRFDQWYKRRINRIYPSVLASSIIALVLFGFHEDFADVLLCRRYWFIGCIFFYYLLLYPIKYFDNGKYVNHVFVGWLALSIAIYPLLPSGYKCFYADGWGRIVIFFLFMLQGAMMGKKQDQYHSKWWHLPVAIICFAIWMCMCGIGRGTWLYFFSIIPFLGVTRYSYLAFSSRTFARLYDTKLGGGLVWLISQLCLECYLIQKFCYSDALNSIFPLNLPIFMAFALATAYLVKMVSQFILQTFDSNPYDWKSIVLFSKGDS